MAKSFLFPAFLIIFSMMAGCNPSGNETKTDLLLADIDTTVSPAQDFFSFANGGWIKKNPIPESESYWSVANLVEEDIYSRLKKINIDAENAKAADGSIEQKIGDFWFSGLDTVQIEKNGLSPLKAQMDLIDSIVTLRDLARVLGLLHAFSIDGFFSGYVAQDAKISENMAFNLNQGGLGMPGRDYYFNTDQKTSAVREAYSRYLFLTFKELGYDSISALKKSLAVFAFETALARSSRKLADLRDPYANYHKMSVADLQKLSPALDWQSYFSNLGIQKLDTIIVGQPEFFAALNRELSEKPIQDIRDYLHLHLIMSTASYLDSSITFKNYFDYNKSLSGVARKKDRWKYVIDAEQSAMGEALGQLFVHEFFSEKAKQRYSDLIEAVRTTYKERIEKLSWMSDTTKLKAISKLSKMTKKVGYPDTWKDFSALKIDRGPFVLNILRARRWWTRYQINRLGKPVDRGEWEITPQTYNAYYNPSNNEIVMPAAAFIIPGMRDEDLDDAFVYGYAAANWIGHEMTHGFDDQGRQFDEKGNLKNWWLPEDSVQFVQRAQKIIKQFDEFNPVDTLHVNGSATQGENIADLGGMRIGLDAFKKTDSYKRGERIGGYTPLQRFFLAYAYGWMFEMRKEMLARQLMTDVHAPAEQRVNGPVVNIPEFYEAFRVKQGDKMFRPDSLKVNIW